MISPLTLTLEVYRFLPSIKILFPHLLFSWRFTGNILLLRPDVIKEIGDALSVAVRDAWLELRAQSGQINQIVPRLLSDKEYLKVLHRTSGLHHYQGLSYESLKAAA